MRFAMFATVRLLILAMVLAYILALLASPCLPVADAGGQVQAIPRWEYWLLHASVPSAIWWQWTGGLQPIVMSDRLPILIAASIWIVSCFWSGKLISRIDPLSDRLSRYERLGVSILIGHVVLSTLVFLYGTFLGTHSLVWLCLLGFILVAWHWRLGAKGSAGVRIESLALDASFASSISRRMVGLLFLATAFLACVQVYGATIPTQDMQVREVNWWIVKHAALDGRIGWSANHAIANAPAGFDMSAVFFSSVLTCDLPDVASHRPTPVDARERWNGRIKTSVLAGKTVNAMLGLVGVLLTGVHLGRRWGILSGLFVSLVLLSTPGFAELTRLGRTEALVGVWAAALMVIWQTWNDSRSDKLPLGLLWGFLLAGAFSSGYGSAVLVGLPAVIFGIANRVGGPHAAATRVVLVGVAIAACSFFVRNAAACGDPIAPWGKVFLAHFVGAIKPDFQVDALVHAHRIPFETVSESIAAESIESNFNIADSIETPYRLVNLLDGILRFLGNSNVHGLMLIPFAVVGCMVGGLKNSRFAIAWVLYWMVLWWVGSMRLDRDWVGSLFLLAWPAALGANWIAGLFRGYAMFAFVLIAILWSVVVIPIWPTSDNRILVALDRIEGGLSGKTTEGDFETNNYARELNDSLKNNGKLDSNSKILLIGENDDFDLLADCVSSGPFDGGLFDKWIDLPAEQMVAAFRRQGISHLLVVWSGVRYRGKLTGRDRENDYRNAIEGMLKGSQLQSIPLGMNSSQAELFLVNRE